MSKTIYGIYSCYEMAAEAINKFEEKGFCHKDFSILSSKEAFRSSKSEADYISFKETEGMTLGMDIGGVAGAVVGGLAAVGTITLTGGAALIAAGPILAAFLGGTLGVSVGGAIGALVEHGVPEAEAQMVDEELNKGKVLLEINVNENDVESELSKILKATNPEKTFCHKYTELDLAMS